MIVLDARGIEINLGSYVRYTGTGTISEVDELKIENKVQWVKLKKTDLWYISKFVEILDSKDIKNKSFKSDEDDGEVNLDTIKQLKDDLENMELDSNVAEGGG